MASQRSTNTMQEFLQRMLGDISMAKTLPDADLEFLIGLETGILQKLREPVDAMAGQMQAMGGGAPSPGASGGGAGVGVAPPPAMSPGVNPATAGMTADLAGIMAGGGNGMTSPDEVRRMVGQ